MKGLIGREIASDDVGGRRPRMRKNRPGPSSRSY
jgi:hypothetical protein